MKFTVIIPTMWKQTKYLFHMLPMYSAHASIKEILIINNEGSAYVNQAELYDKVRILNDGKNIYVNPAWNLGVREAACECVIIANDDISFSFLEKVLELAEEHLVPGKIIGFHKNSFPKHRDNTIEEVTIVKPERGYHSYGFGTFMAVYRDSWVMIPDNMVVWAGDSLQFQVLEPFLIQGIPVDTPMRGTSRYLSDVKRYRQFDVVNFNDYLIEHRKPVKAKI